MNLTVNREDLLGRLQLVEPGLSAKEILQQSGCYIFQRGEIVTFNEEIACRIKSKLDKKFTGAVQAKPLLELLQKMREETVELEVADAELLVTGVRKKAGVRLEKEVLLEVSVVSEPGEFADLPEEFGEAVEHAVACAGRDESMHNLVCVHVTPKYLEAMDNSQAIRYKLKLPVENGSLVRHDSLKQAAMLGVTQVSDTEGWMHFRNPSGLVISCRKYAEDYPDLAKEGVFNVKGEPTVLPSGLEADTEMANIFSKDNTDDDKILIELRPGKMRMRGEGVNGWYQSVKKVKYAGEDAEFLIAPSLLLEITKRHTNCEISPTRLKVDGGKYVYVSLLTQKGVKVEDAGEVEESEEESTEE